MEQVQKLSLLTLRQLLAAVYANLAQDRKAEIAALLARHAADPRLSAALHRAHARAWKALEIVLAGESFWDGCQVFLAPEECRALRDKVQALRAQTPLQAAGANDDLRIRCLRELRKAQQSGLLAEEPLDTQALRQQLSPPPGAPEEQAHAAGQLAAELRQAGYPALAGLLESTSPAQAPVPVAALNFFLRRELSAEPELHGLALDGLRPLPEAQESALALLADVLTTHGRGLQEWLDEGEEPAPAAAATPPAADNGESAEGASGRRRISLLAWVGTLAVLILPVLLLVLLISSYAIRAERRFVGHKGAVKSLAFSPDGERIFSGGDDKTVRTWDVATGKELASFQKHVLPVTSLAVSTDGKRVLSADRGTVRLWEAEGGKEIAALPLPEHVMAIVAFTSAGPRALSFGGLDHLLQLWDVGNRQPLHSVALDAGPVNSLALSADGNLGMAGGDKDIYLWDLKKPQNLRTLSGHTGRVTALTFRSDGQQLASGSVDETIRVWDVVKGEQRAELRGPASPVVSLAFSPDGNLLLSGSSGSKGDVFKAENPVVDRRTFRLWGLEAGRDLCLFDGPSGPVWAVAFAPDGHKVLSGSGDGVVRLWALPQ